MNSFGIRTPITYAYLYKNSTDEKIYEIQQLNEFIMKPNFAAQGLDVYCVEKIQTKNGIKYREIDGRIHDWSFIIGKIKYMIKIHKFVLVEERIHNPSYFHPFLNGIDGIVDIRLYIVDDEIMFGKVRVPIRKSEGYANTGRKATAMFIGPDGIIQEDHIFDNTSPIHPETGLDFIGRRIPMWDSLHRTADIIAKNIAIPFHSIDITLGLTADKTQGNPVIIESEKIPLLSHFTPTGCEVMINRIEQYKRRVSQDCANPGTK